MAERGVNPPTSPARSMKLIKERMISMWKSPYPILIAKFLSPVVVTLYKFTVPDAKETCPCAIALRSTFANQ
jgi:hypothetical protein